MTTTIERMAKAVAHAEYFEPGFYRDSDHLWESLDEEQRVTAREQVRAALAVLCKPSEAMLKAGMAQREKFLGSAAWSIWEVMIEAALAEAPQ